MNDIYIVQEQIQRQDSKRFLHIPVYLHDGYKPKKTVYRIWGIQLRIYFEDASKNEEREENAAFLKNSLAAAGGKKVLSWKTTILT